MLATVVVGVGDTELSRVLVLASALDDEHHTVVGDIGNEVSAGGPGEVTVVRDLLGDGLERLDVGAGTTQEDQGDGTLGGRLPLDGEGLAGGDLLLETRLDDGVARGVLRVVRLGVSCDDSREGGNNGGESETHCGCLLFVVVEGNVNWCR